MMADAKLQVWMFSVKSCFHSGKLTLVPFFFCLLFQAHNDLAEIRLG